MAVSVRSEPRSLTASKDQTFSIQVTVSGAEPGRISIRVETTERCTFSDGTRKKWRSRVVGGTTATFTLFLSLHCECEAGAVLNTRLLVEGWDSIGDRADDRVRVRYRC
jgi:hypothetical protein